MNNSSVLGEIVALFDGALDKICPVLGMDSLLTPATFVRITSAERDSFSGGFKVIFELKHRYRDADPSDGIEAFRYLEHLIKAAEDTDKATVLSFEGGGSSSDGSVAECSAKLAYTSAASSESFSLVTDAGDISHCVKRITLKEDAAIRSHRYIDDLYEYRERICETLRLGIECTPDGISKVQSLLYGGKARLTLNLCGLMLRGEFVLCGMNASDSLCLELLSSGAVERGASPFYAGLTADEEGGAA